MYDKGRNTECSNRHGHRQGRKRHYSPIKQKSSTDENLLEIKLLEPKINSPKKSSSRNSKTRKPTPCINSETSKDTCNSNETRRGRSKTFNFRIVVNSGGGDCLFLTLSEFLGDPKTGGSGSYLNVLHDQLRKTIVNYIVKPDDNNVQSYSIWSRYRQGIKISLEKHVRFFRTFNIENTDPRVEAIAREEYQQYMSQAGVFGTYVELCAAMEIYRFSTTLIEEASPSNRAAYFVYHLDLVDKNNNLKRKKYAKKQNLRAHILFTGSIEQGHFELLYPTKPKKPTTIPKGVYGVQEKNDQLRYLALVQAKTGDGNDTEIECVNKKYHFDPFNKNNLDNDALTPKMVTRAGLKRDLLASQECQEQSPPSPPCPVATKRMKTTSCTDNDYDQDYDHDHDHDDEEQLEPESYEPTDKISKILHESSTCSGIGMDSDSKLLIENELEKLAQLYTVTLSELKKSFEVRISKDIMKHTSNNEWPGVRNSRVLSFGRFQTAFMHFEPYTFTPFCPTMGAVNCIVYNGDAVLVTELDKNENEIECNLRTGEFSLEIGSLYTLENNSDFPLLLRVLWID